MPGKRITDLTALSGAGSANNDDVVIFDATANETKRISRSQLAEGMQADVQVLSNKTITLGSNTVTGTTAQFNTALTDNNFATQAGAETLTNKTINARTNTLQGSDASRLHWFKDVAALLADTTLVAATGDVVQTRKEGFSYRVAASSATDQHKVTSGGVKLYEANPFSSKTNLKSLETTSLSEGTSVLVNGNVYKWDATVPIQVHQADTRETVFVAPNAAVNGAWVKYYDKPSLSAFDQIKMKMVRQRVDFVSLGDSNQLFNGIGWDQGFHVALQQIAPSFGTGLITMYTNGGTTQGHYYSSLSSGQTFATTGAPSAVQKYFDIGLGNLGHIRPAYLESGTASATAQLGINIDVGWPGGTQNELRYDVYTVSFDSGSGQFRLFHRLSDDTMQERGSTILTNTGVLGNIVKSSLTRSARTAPTLTTQFMMNQLSYSVNSATPIIGPFFNTYERVTVPATKTGWAVSTLYGIGGQSMRDVAYAMQQASDETLVHFFSILRADQFEAGAVNACIAITVNFGLNDTNETLTSVGPAAITTGDSAEAFVDNFVALRQRIEGIWTAQGWPTLELNWIIFPSHPISSPDNSKLLAYRKSISQYVSLLPRTQFLNLEEITTSTEMLDNNWYASSSDRSHLSQEGYEQLSKRLLYAIE
jgi:hypothetical protein